MFTTTIKSFFRSFVSDPVIEGLYADQYTDSESRDQISGRYKERYQQHTTPLTHPWLFDPLNPPRDWRYDPYYELWIKIK
jgi:hypothetical protein